MKELYTIGDLTRHESLKGFSRRQLEYALQDSRIDPVGRLGIIRAFSENQIPLILAAVQRTARKRDAL